MALEILLYWRNKEQGFSSLFFLSQGDQVCALFSSLVFLSLPV